MKAFIVLAIVAAACAEPEAEADPQLLYAGAYPGYYGHAYAGYYGYPYGAYYGFGKSAPCVNAANQPVPCAQPGLAKREAEADPAVLYSGFYGHPYGYAGYGGYYGYGAGYYGAYGYPYGAYYGFGKSAPCVNAANQPVPCA